MTVCLPFISHEGDEEDTGAAGGEARPEEPEVGLGRSESIHVEDDPMSAADGGIEDSKWAF